MKREEALAKFREEEQNYIDGIKAGFLVKIQENGIFRYQDRSRRKREKGYHVHPFLDSAD